MTLRSSHGSSSDTDRLLEQAARGEQEALAQLFQRYRRRLHGMLDLRLDRRLRGRVDTSDVLQEAYLEVMRSFRAYQRRPGSSFFLWLRRIVSRKLVALHRRHLGVQARDVRREFSLYRGAYPQASSEALAARLLGHATSPSEKAMRAERRLQLEQALDEAGPLDREVLALRHFERLSNVETAAVLGIDESAASKRYVRALKRVKEILKARGETGPD